MLGLESKSVPLTSQCSSNRLPHHNSPHHLQHQNRNHPHHNYQQSAATVYSRVKTKTVAQPDLLCDSLPINAKQRTFQHVHVQDSTPSLFSPTNNSIADGRLSPSHHSHSTTNNKHCDSSSVDLQDSGQNSPGYFSGHSSLSSTGSAHATQFNTIEKKRSTSTATKHKQPNSLSSNSSLNSSTSSPTVTCEQNGIMRKSVSEYNHCASKSAKSVAGALSSNEFIPPNHHRVSMRSAYVSPQQPHQTLEQYRQQQHLINKHQRSSTVAQPNITCATQHSHQQHSPMPGMAQSHNAHQFVSVSSAVQHSHPIQSNVRSSTVDHPPTVTSMQQPLSFFPSSPPPPPPLPPSLAQLPSPSGFTATGVQPLIAIRRVMLLYENLQHEEAANFIIRLADQCFPLVAKELPIGLFIEQMPQSLHVLEALYAKLLLSAETVCCTLTACPVYGSLLKALQPESVTMHLVKLFALRTQTSHVLDQSTATCNGSVGSGNNTGNHSSAVLHCTLPAPFQDRLDSNQLLMLTIRKLLRAILVIQPSICKQLTARKRAIDNAIDALGHHGLVSVSGRAALEALNAASNGNLINNGPIMLSLQEAIRLECEQLVQQQRQVLNKLEQICIGNGCKDGTLNGVKGGFKTGMNGMMNSSKTSLSVGSGSLGGVANGNSLPVSASHQRQLSLRPEEIQNRLLRNRQMLTALEQFGAGQQSLQLLMQMLDARIQYDKETLFQFGQLRKEFNYCCTVSRRLCGALLGNGGATTLDGAHSCTGRLSGHSDVGRNDSNSGNNSGTMTTTTPTSNGSTTTTTSSNGQALVTSHVMGCCIESNAVVAPVLMRFSFGCAQVLQLFDQVTTEIPSLKEENVGVQGVGVGCAKHGPAESAVSVDQQLSSTESIKTITTTTATGITTTSALNGSTTVALVGNRNSDQQGREQDSANKIKTDNNFSTQPTQPTQPTSSPSLSLRPTNVPCALLVDVNDHTANSGLEPANCCTKTGDTVTIKGSIWTQQVRLQSCSPSPPQSPNRLLSCTQTSTASSPPPLHSSSNLTERLQQAESRIQQLEQTEIELRRQLQPRNATQSSKLLLNPLSPLRSTGISTTATTDALDRLDLTQPSIKSNSTMVDTRSSSSGSNLDQNDGRDLFAARRPIALIRRYGDLYAQARGDTLDALDRIEQLKQAHELKCKLLFSVLVLSFRCVQKSITQLKQNICSLLQIRSNNASENGDFHTTTTDGIAIATDSKHMSDVVDRDVVSRDAILNLERAINDYLRDCGDQFDLEPRVEEVFTQICSTLFDYPCLRNCFDLLAYVRNCVRLAWALSTHTPVYVIRFDSTVFDPLLHIRFHTSDVNSERIICHVWPALLEEGTNGSCVHKGVVIT